MSEIQKLSCPVQFLLAKNKMLLKQTRYSLNAHSNHHIKNTQTCMKYNSAFLVARRQTNVSKQSLRCQPYAHVG